MFTLRSRDRFWVELQAVDGQGFMAHAHDLAVAAGGLNEAFGDLVDDERMIARDLSLIHI